MIVSLLPLSYPAVPLSRCPAIPLSRCSAIPLSRCPAVPLSRYPAMVRWHFSWRPLVGSIIWNWKHVFTRGATPLSSTVSVVGPAFSPPRLCVRQCVWSAREKSLEILCHGRKMSPGHREDSPWDSFLLPLRHCDSRDSLGLKALGSQSWRVESKARSQWAPVVSMSCYYTGCSHSQALLRLLVASCVESDLFKSVQKTGFLWMLDK